MELGGYGHRIDYSLYADLHFRDGSQEWAYYAAFDPQKEGWQHTYGEVLVSLVTSP